MPSNWSISSPDFSTYEANTLVFLPTQPKNTFNCTPVFLDTENITPASRKNRYSNDLNRVSYLDVTSGGLTSPLRQLHERPPLQHLFLPGRQDHPERPRRCLRPHRRLPFPHQKSIR